MQEGEKCGKRGGIVEENQPPDLVSDLINYLMVKIVD
jgi:hypothetical protein